LRSNPKSLHSSSLSYTNTAAATAATALTTRSCSFYHCNCNCNNHVGQRQSSLTVCLSRSRNDYNENDNDEQEQEQPHSKQENNDDNPLLLFTAVNKLVDLATRPVSLPEALPYTLTLGYPLTLLGVTVVGKLNLSSTLLLIVLFVGFSVLGQSFLQADNDTDDKDKNEHNDNQIIEDDFPVEFLALLASVFSTLLLVSNPDTSVAPLSISNQMQMGAFAIAFGIIIVGSSLLKQPQPPSSLQRDNPTKKNKNSNDNVPDNESDVIIATTIEQERMELWDQEFSQQKQQQPNKPPNEDT